MTLSVRSLCLAILSHGDATGYEIRKESTEGRFSYFEMASFGSIYPALSRLETEGHVTVREEAQSGKPTRKVYSITDSGRAAFIQELMEPPAPDTFKSPFLLTALYAEHVGPDVIRQSLECRCQQIRDELALMAEIKEEDNGDPASSWTTDYGFSCMTASLAFLEERGEELIKIAAGSFNKKPQTPSSENTLPDTPRVRAL